MTPQDALAELLTRVGARDGAAVFVSDEELSGWPAAAVAAMKVQKLLVKARPAASSVCPGCERECVMPVHTQPVATGNSVSFVVCDKRSDINRVPVAAERLTQWRCDAHAVVGFIAASLGLRRSEQPPNDACLLTIGIAHGDKRSQMLCLRAEGGLALVAGNNALPLAELIDHNDGTYLIDGELIRQLVDSATTADDRHSPTTARREARKLATQTMYRNWQKAYRDWKRKRPGMSDVWYSKQISRTDLTNGRDAETIRKRMK